MLEEICNWKPPLNFLTEDIICSDAKSPPPLLSTENRRLQFTSFFSQVFLFCSDYFGFPVKLNPLLPLLLKSGISIKGRLHDLVFGTTWACCSEHSYRPYYHVTDLWCDIYPGTWPIYKNVFIVLIVIFASSFTTVTKSIKRALLRRRSKNPVKQLTMLCDIFTICYI